MSKGLPCFPENKEGVQKLLLRVLVKDYRLSSSKTHNILWALATYILSDEKFYEKYSQLHGKSVSAHTKSLCYFVLIVEELGDVDEMLKERAKEIGELI